MLILDLLELFDHPGIMNYLSIQLKMDRSNKPEYEKRCISMLGKYGDYTSINFLHTLKTEDNSSTVDKAINAIQERIGSGDSGWLSAAAPEDDEGLLSLDFEKNES